MRVNLNVAQDIFFNLILIALEILTTATESIFNKLEIPQMLTLFLSPQKL